MLKISVCILITGLYASTVFAQTDTTRIRKTTSATTDSVSQKDIGDLLDLVFKRNKKAAGNTVEKKLNISVIPSIGYTLTTGFVADLAGNGEFFTTADHKENPSVVDADLSYDTNIQKIVVSRSEIWYHNNSYKLVTDIRWLQFPEDTYGIGTGPAEADPILFNYARVYAKLYKKIIPDKSYYIGMGYNLDYHYNIKETSTPANVTDFEAYNGQRTNTTSSGLNIDFLYDSRTNTINPKNGMYAGIVYTQNMKLLGSNSYWEALQFDFRKYYKLSATSNNIFALWASGWFTKGNPPYLDLPYTGGDTYNNTGRGYIQGRFIGRNMLYIEGEYRFGILRNGLLGGVVFTNAESMTEYQSNNFQHIAPAAGTGLRVKVNKHSDTNVCVDYGVGLYGSHGFFVNLGEIF